MRWIRGPRCDLLLSPGTSPDAQAHAGKGVMRLPDGGIVIVNTRGYCAGRDTLWTGYWRSAEDAIGALGLLSEMIRRG